MSLSESPFQKLVKEVLSRVKELTIQDVRALRERGEKFHLVDVREESEWAAGHLPGAIHLSKGVIERDITDKISDRDATVVLYCGGGSRSVLAADNLQKMDYRKVFSMEGGWRGWKAAGLSVEQD